MLVVNLVLWCSFISYGLTQCPISFSNGDEEDRIIFASMDVLVHLCVCVSECWNLHERVVACWSVSAVMHM